MAASDIPWEPVARSIPDGGGYMGQEPPFREVLEKAIEAYGGIRPAGRAMGIPEASIRRWRKNENVKPSEENRSRVKNAVPGLRRRMALSEEREKKIRNGELRAKMKANFPQGRTDKVRKRTLDLPAGNKGAYLRAVNRMLDAWLKGESRRLPDYVDEMVEAYADGEFDVDEYLTPSGPVGFYFA